jgi:ribonuclease M5
MAEKLKIKEVVAVEGRYDAHAVRACVDTTVVELGGFHIFKNRKLEKLLKAYAESRGLILLTDSDGAGFLIRNRLKGVIKNGRVRNAYIPSVPGREKRKAGKSPGGLLGVEGMDAETIVKALLAAGATVEDAAARPEEKRLVTRTDLYEDGLYGKKNSRALRNALTEALGLPSLLSVNALTDAINGVCGYQNYRSTVEKIKAGLTEN